MVDIKKLIGKWEEDYKNEKKVEIEELYNKIATSIEGCSIENILAAIELIKETIIKQKMKEIRPDL